MMQLMTRKKSAIPINESELPLFLTMQEAVDYSRLSIETVRKAIKEGKLIASQPSGREWRIAKTDFIQWMTPDRKTMSTINLNINAAKFTVGPKSTLLQGAVDDHFTSIPEPLESMKFQVSGADWNRTPVVGEKFAIPLKPPVGTLMARTEKLSGSLEGGDLVVEGIVDFYSQNQLDALKSMHQKTKED